MDFQGRVVRAVLLGACLGVGACASQGSLPDAKDQMKFAARMARRGYWHEAEFRWAKVMAERPNDPELWNNLAVAHESLGNFSEALRHYKRALELAPNNRQIRQNYARFAEFYSDYSRKEPEQEPPLLPKEDDPFRRR